MKIKPLINIILFVGIFVLVVIDKEFSVPIIAVFCGLLCVININDRKKRRRKF